MSDLSRQYIFVSRTGSHYVFFNNTEDNGLESWLGVCNVIQNEINEKANSLMTVCFPFPHNMVRHMWVDKTFFFCTFLSNSTCLAKCIPGMNLLKLLAVHKGLIWLRMLHLRWVVPSRSDDITSRKAEFKSLKSLNLLIVCSWRERHFFFF